MFGFNRTIPKFCDLRGKVAIITGAKQGMGKAHALKLAAAGAKVVVSDISKEECQLVVDEIKNPPTGGRGEAIAVKCDISNKVDVDNLIKETLNKFKKIDILVNNAGVFPFKPFLEMTEQDFTKVININLKGYFLCSQAAAKEMAKNSPAGKGSIVNIASIAAMQGFAGLAHYCASKGGVVAMSKAMALELAPMGIRVNNVDPGAIETPGATGGADKQGDQNMVQNVPMKRWGKAEEISNAVLFLASDESSYMTGSTIVVDGGWTAQ